MRWRDFIDSLSLSGSIILMLFVVTMFGLAMEWQGKPNAREVWMTAFSAFTSFIGGRYLKGKSDDGNNSPGDGQRPSAG